jgi:hypothetical protein
MSDAPRCELTAEDAFGSMNYYEIQDMKKHFGVSMSQLEGLAVEAMYALVWVMERRADVNCPIGTVKEMPFTAVSGYFAEADPAGELGEAGKDERPGDTS